MNSYKLNEGQADALTKFEKFLKSDSKFFILSGGGGVGKTFLTARFVTMVNKRKDYSCTVCATTHKAVAVLQDSLDMYGVKANVNTIHSTLGLTMIKEGPLEKCVPGKEGLEYIHNSVLFVDECSMIDKFLLNFILEAVSFGQSKVVFIGDDHQLPPVGEVRSKIYDLNHVSAELVQPVRNSERPEIMALCAEARLGVETGDLGYVRKLINGPSYGAISVCRGRELIDAFDAMFREEGNNTSLQYMNKDVMKACGYIRSKLRGYTPKLVVGEYVINNTHLQYTNKNSIKTDRQLLTVDVGPTTSSKLGYDMYPITLKELSGKQHTVEVFLNPQDRSNLLGKYKRECNWNMFYRIKDKNPDLRCPGARTVHKSQGSTFTNIMVDFSSLKSCKDRNLLPRLCYVALTRASSSILIKPDS